MSLGDRQRQGGKIHQKEKKVGQGNLQVSNCQLKMGVARKWGGGGGDGEPGAEKKWKLRTITVPGTGNQRGKAHAPHAS